MVEVTIKKYSAPVKVNPYTETVTKLLEVGDEFAAELAAVPNGSVAKTVRTFGEAANAVERTARRRDVLVNGESVEYKALADLPSDTAVTLVMALGPKQVRSGRPRKDAAADEPVTVTAPADEPAPAAPAKRNGK